MPRANGSRGVVTEPHPDSVAHQQQGTGLSDLPLFWYDKPRATYEYCSTTRFGIHTTRGAGMPKVGYVVPHKMGLYGSPARICCSLVCPIHAHAFASLLFLSPMMGSCCSPGPTTTARLMATSILRRSSMRACGLCMLARPFSLHFESG